MDSHLYPLRFQPLFRQYIWGGRRLQTELGKKLDSAGIFAESWEIVDRGMDQSIVEFGDLKGRSLQQLIAEFGPQLLGDYVFEQVTDSRVPEYLQHRFPLLFKFLDAHQTLSVQVHPDDNLAMLLEPPDLGKTEAWYVIDADPQALIYAGLLPGVDPEQLENACTSGATDSVLHSFHPKPGDCVFIPAGTVHAIGAGLLVAEIQQSSDTTYRLFDWNRLDAQGNSRELHINEAIHSTNYHLGPVGPQKPKLTEFPEAVELVNCDKFVLNKWCIEQPMILFTNDCFRILAVVHGSMDVSSDPSGIPLNKGQTMLIPAAQDKIRLHPHEPVEFLEIFVPRSKRRGRFEPI
ncbi:MAG TPA: class I mannose-6-phosphate isomerase [Pirellulaceae bacterium]|nr:class I mannose-6-phosphate isomerase [Pirellulaceae bacterium]HMO92302.1 class I mannose-6-phosphate isomerase [Pirellulaceae bacterium]HMP69226.1 class I mannose-6-phosphate isomerase [Pirellulaceae bacterium]